MPWLVHIIQQDDELIGEDWLDSYLTNTILDAKYEQEDVHDVATNQKTSIPRSTT